MTEPLDYVPRCEDCRTKLTRDDVLRADDICAHCFDLRLHRSNVIEAERRCHRKPGPVPGMTEAQAAMYSED